MRIEAHRRNAYKRFHEITTRWADNDVVHAYVDLATRRSAAIPDNRRELLQSIRIA